MKKSYCQKAERLYFTGMGRRPQYSNRYQMWVVSSHLRRNQLCKISFFYRANSFWVVFPLTRQVTFTQHLELY